MGQLTREDFELIYSYGMDEPACQEALMQAMENFVLQHHTNSITQIQTGSKKGMWKTYIGKGGDRQPITRKERQDIFSFLYKHYKNAEDTNKTLSAVFDSLMSYKKGVKARSSNTISEDKRIMGLLPDDIKSQPLRSLTEEDICGAVIKTVKGKETPETLNKIYNLLNQIYRYGIKKKACAINVMAGIDKADYKKLCRPSGRTSEERQFSQDEIERIREDCWKDIKNPRAQMTLLAIETGIRAAELSALLKEDIQGDYIHVHRQQIRDRETKPQTFYNVEYTKDERNNPHNGRYVPITDECRKIIDYVQALKTESEFFFSEHNEQIRKDGYEYNLRKRVKRLGIKTSHNHAFRVAFNSRMIRSNIPATDRALVLGHEVQTNEEHYSITDSRRLDVIKQELTQK